MRKLAIVVLGLLMFENAHATCNTCAAEGVQIPSSAPSGVYSEESSRGKITVGSDGGASAGWKPK